jgi:hypothetical protein
MLSQLANLARVSSGLRSGRASMEGLVVASSAAAADVEFSLGSFRCCCHEFFFFVSDERPLWSCNCSNLWPRLTSISSNALCFHWQGPEEEDEEKDTSGDFNLETVEDEFLFAAVMDHGTMGAYEPHPPCHWTHVHPIKFYAKCPT